MADERVPTSSLTSPRPMRLAKPAATTALTPKEVMGIIRRHMFMIIFLTFLGIVAGGTSWYLFLRYAPKYTATTLLEVLPPVEADPMEVRGVMVNKDIQYGYRRSIASLMQQQSTLQELLSRDKVQDTKWFKKFGEEDEKAKRLQKAYEDLLDSLGVSAQREGSFVVVSMTCGSSKESAVIVNELVELFLSKHGQRERNEATERLKMLEARRKEVQADLNFAEQQLDTVRKDVTAGYSDFSQEQYRDTAQVRLDNLQIERDRLALDISRLQGLVKTLKRQATGPIEFQVENQIESDPIMITLGQQIALQKSSLAGSKTKFGENHREVRRTRELIKEIEAKRQQRRKEIAEQVRQSNLRNAQDSLASLLDEYEELQKRFTEAKKQKEDYDRRRAIYEERKKLVDERQETLDNIKRRIEAQKMLVNDPETAKVKSVGLAPEPRQVSFPKWQIFFPGGTFLGFLLGLGLAFLVELVNDLVRTPRDVSRYLHIPLLGVIPDSQEDGQVRSVDLYQVVRQAPYSILSEAYRSLRTHFDLSKSKESSKVVLISSGMPGEGNTSVAVNFATAVTAVGKKVLLIDANFRRPKLHKIFPKPSPDAEHSQKETGLSTFLSGESDLESVVRSTEVEGLNVIDAGPVLANPAELLSGLRMQELLKLVSQKYDRIIIDGPPVLLVTDAKLLGSITDAVLLVFNAKTTHRGAAQRMIRELKELDASIFGCVVFGVRAMKGGYFREQYKTFRKYQQQVTGAA